MSAARYRSYPVDCFTLTNGNVLVLKSGTADATTLSALDTALLANCASWKSLDDHAASYLSAMVACGLRRIPGLREGGRIEKLVQAASRSVSPSLLSQLPTWVEIRSRLTELEKRGLLISESNRVDRFVDPAVDTTLTLCVPSGGAVSMLRRVLDSYCNMARIHAHRFEEIAVASLSPDSKPALNDIEVRYRTRTRLLDSDWRARIAGKISRLVDVPYTVLEFALFGHPGIRVTTGANRNALLLNTVGRVSLNVDDDTIARAITPEPVDVDVRKPVKTISEIDPSEFWFFADAQHRAFQQHDSPLDMIGAHRELLGRPLCGILTGADLSDGCHHLLKDIVTGSGRIVLTHAGLAGDSGMSGASGLHFLAGPSRERMLATEKSYRDALSSRQIIRVPRVLSIGHGLLCMSTCIGLDGRQMLPPFLPVFRNSDGLFGYMLRLLFEDKYVAYLPFAVEHYPIGSRTYGAGAADDFINVFDSAILWECIREIASTLQRTPTPCARLRIVGEHLNDIGTVSPAVFTDYLRRIRIRVASERIAFCRDQLLRYGNTPLYWAGGVRSLQEEIENTVQRGACAVSSSTAPENAEIMQKVIAKYGNLLQAWPIIWEAALQLKDSAAKEDRCDEPFQSSRWTERFTRI